MRLEVIGLKPPSCIPELTKLKNVPLSFETASLMLSSIEIYLLR